MHVCAAPDGQRRRGDYLREVVTWPALNRCHTNRPHGVSSRTDQPGRNRMGVFQLRTNYNITRKMAIWLCINYPKQWPVRDRSANGVFTPQHRTHSLDAAYSYERSSVVCLSVCRSAGHECEPCKNGWTDRDVVSNAVASGRPKAPRIRCGANHPTERNTKRTKSDMPGVGYTQCDSQGAG